jgi:hypothetical protein
MPLILWFSLPTSCEGIIDFVRENTLHLEGIGYVCSYAAFDTTRENVLRRNNGLETQANHGDLKMEQSIVGFKASYPDWNRDIHIEGSQLNANSNAASKSAAQYHHLKAYGPKRDSRWHAHYRDRL